MDRTSIIVLVLCLLLMFCIMFLPNKIFPPKPLPPGATKAPAAASGASNLGPNSVLAGTTNSAPLPFAGIAANLSTNEPEQLLELTNGNVHYTFTSRGGGLKLVELNNYPETVSTRRSRQQATSRGATLNSFTPAPTLAILDGPEVQGDGVFKLSHDGNKVIAEKTLTNGLTLVKEFEASTNYLMFAKVRFENRSDQALALPPQEWFAGTATPMNAQDDGSAVGVMWHNAAKSQDISGASYFSSRGFMCMPKTPPAEYRGSNVVWAAAHNQFFALIVMPQEPASQIVVRKIDLPPPAAEEITYRTVRQPVGYEVLLHYTGTNVPARQAVEKSVVIYAGPKEYRTLSTVAATFNNEVDDVMSFSGILGAGFFAKGLLLGMNWLHHTLRLSYGWAIIAITIFIKVVFWPLTAASARSAKRMQVLQPQIKALQEKYKDDPVKSQRKMMEFWKEHKVNPMSGCLPTVIQMPVFFGFFVMIRSAIELRGAPFLWVGDLSRPDTLFNIPGLGFPFNLLPLIMGGTMLWQARLAPPSPGMDPTQAKMMRYMPLMFMVFLYNFSAGLTLYWTVQNLLSIVQTKLTRTLPEKPATPGLPPSSKGPGLTPSPKKRK